MGLFWKKSAEAPAGLPCAPGVPEWLRANGGGEFVRGYEAQVDEVFRTNPIGQRSVRLVSSGVGAQAVRMALADALGRRTVAHIKALNPLDDHYGLGCLDAAIAPASVHNRASRWNKMLLDNAARPSGALTYDPGDGSVLSQEQFGRLRSELETLFSGADHAGRPLLLDGGMKWQSLSMTPADMDFVALKEGAARDIALAFGVPPVLVGLPGDATYSNAREAGRALTRQTVLPMARKILAGLEAMIEDWVGPVGLAVNTDELSELAEDRLKLWEAVSKANFLSPEEKRAMLGFETGDGA
ncbi:MAG: phage portal protein [Sphingomonadales bacterium]|nr:phage portal protein [Sphingomonadales bacterium]